MSAGVRLADNELVKGDGLKRRVMFEVHEATERLCQK